MTAAVAAPSLTITASTLVAARLREDDRSLRASFSTTAAQDSAAPVATAIAKMAAASKTGPVASQIETAGPVVIVGSWQA